jgi:post-segregation antitoxin (ccd killing protein)
MDIHALSPANTQAGTSANIVQMRDRVDRAWNAYVDAKKLVDATMCKEDAVAAGRAWRLFLREFSRFEGEQP